MYYEGINGRMGRKSASIDGGAPRRLKIPGIRTVILDEETKYGWLKINQRGVIWWRFGHAASPQVRWEDLEAAFWAASGRSPPSRLARRRK